MEQEMIEWYKEQEIMNKYLRSLVRFGIQRYAWVDAYGRSRGWDT